MNYRGLTLTAVLTLMAAVPLCAADAVSLAVSALTDIYVRPLQLRDVMFVVHTDSFAPGDQPTTIFVDLVESRSCCISRADPAYPAPLLTFSVFVFQNGIRGISASGRLIDQPDQFLAQSVKETTMVAAIRKSMGWAGVATSESQVVNGSAIRRLVFGRRRNAIDHTVILDARSHVPRLIGVP